MKAKKNLIFLVAILCFLLPNSAKAVEQMTFWLECGYKENDGIEVGRPLVFIGGYNINSKKNEGYYRLINPLALDVNKAPALDPFYSRDNPYFDGCWFKDSQDIGNSCLGSSEKYSESEALAMLRSGVCPAIMRKSNDLKNGLVFAGEGTTIKSYKLTNQYTIYSAPFVAGVLAEGLDINGYYVYSIDGEKKDSLYSGKDNIDWRIKPMNRIATMREKFINVAEDYMTSENIYFDSNQNINKLYSAVDKWNQSYGSGLAEKSQRLEKIKSKNANLIYSCQALNEKMDKNVQYSFENGYSAKQMLKDLDSSWEDLNSFYLTYSSKGKSEYPLCKSSASTTTEPIKSAFNCAMTDLLGDPNYIPKELQEFVYRDISEYLKNQKQLNVVDESDDILKTLYKCSMYLDKNAMKFDLDKKETNAILEKYEIIGKENKISIIIDCKSLIGRELYEKIKSYVNIVKIIIPIILISFGIIDFAKAVFSGTEENLKKAQKDFIKRLGITILIFFVPVLIDFILSIANKVWPIISNDTCGLF